MISLIFAVGLFVYELRERQDERTARSWQLVTAPAPGNSGKIEALEYPNSQYGCLPNWATIYWCWKMRTSLTGIDLGRENDKAGVSLRNVDLSDAGLIGANLSSAEFKNVRLDVELALNTIWADTDNRPQNNSDQIAEAIA